jgi:hypothetical protein
MQILKNGADDAFVLGLGHQRQCRPVGLFQSRGG